VFQAPAPELPIEKGRPGPALLANVAVSKYCDGLPLYRQSVILEREGIEIDRATMAEWMGHVAWWVLPVAGRIEEYVIGQQVIWTDDTPILTLAPGSGGVSAAGGSTSQGVRSSLRGQAPRPDFRSAARRAARSPASCAGRDGGYDA